MEKTLKVLASLFWIIGLAASIIGLNIKTDTGRWISVIGNITFAQAAGQSIIRAMHIIFILCTLLSVLGVYCSSRRS